MDLISNSLFHLEDVTFDVYRDGFKIAENATSPPFTEEQIGTACYSVVAKWSMPHNHLNPSAGGRQLPSHTILVGI